MGRLEVDNNGKVSKGCEVLSCSDTYETNNQGHHFIGNVWHRSQYFLVWARIINSCAEPLVRSHEVDSNQVFYHEVDSNQVFRIILCSDHLTQENQAQIPLPPVET